jgi:hypothetical protein
MWRKFWGRKQNTFDTAASRVLPRNEIHIRVCKYQTGKYL